MAKSRVITFRLSDEEYLKLRSLLADKTIAQFMRYLVEKEVSNVKSEVNSFKDLLKAIESADTSKMIERLDKIIDALKTINGNMNKVFMLSKRINFLIEEYINHDVLRSDHRSAIFEKVKQRIEGE